MMAASTVDQQKIQYTTSKSDQSINSDSEERTFRSDTSEQEYFDANSHVSVQSISGSNDLLCLSEDEETSEDMGPKIVETVAKKHFDVAVELETKNEFGQESVFPGFVKPLNKIISESVIDREIRYQKEREEALIKEREEALKTAATSSHAASNTSIQWSPKPIPLPVIYSAQNYYVQTAQRETSTSKLSTIISPFNPAETRIALELREMREREEELRKLRKVTLHAVEDLEVQGVSLIDDSFGNIPNIDEGNFSENGSEEKEIDAEESRNVISLEVPIQDELSHHRTQSVDSTSSGHSSGSGGISENVLVRRRIVVKPFEDAQDDEVPPYMRKHTETPIEREIRLAREREEELRREKGLLFLNGSITTPSLPKSKAAPVKPTSKLISGDPRSVQHRLATSRMQHEIDEAAERESELRKAGVIQTTSEETLDSKVTRFTDLLEDSIDEQDRKMNFSSPTPNTLVSSPIADISDNSEAHMSPPDKTTNMASPAASTQNSISISRMNISPNVTPKVFSMSLVPKGQRGFMERFIASRGKLGVQSSSNPITVSNSFGLHPNANVYKPSLLTPEEFQVIEENEPSENERSENSRLAIRPKYTPAEEKIQNELKDMQRREEELRLQRAHMFACSQPNLSIILDDVEEEKGLKSLCDTQILRASQSNPNLVDCVDDTTVEECEIALEERAGALMGVLS